MTDLLWAILYKVIIAVVGLIIIVLGYFLFKKGVSNESGSFSLNHLGNSISIRGAAGIFFCVLGSLIILGAVFTGIEIKSHATGKNKNDNEDLKNLVVDSTTLPNPSTVVNVDYSINVDSLLNLSKESMKKKQYLIALKYLYFIKGVLVFEKESPEIKKEISTNIKKCEQLLSNILSQNTSNSFKDETRSTKIDNESSDSIR